MAAINPDRTAAAGVNLHGANPHALRKDRR
jgi:hypothetical protein